MDFALRAAVESAAQASVVEASKNKSFPFNPDAALYKTADNMGLGDIKTDEVRFTHGGETYIAQGFSEGILWVHDGDWGDIRKVAWPAPAASTSGTSGGMMSGEGSATQSGSGTTLESGGGEASASGGGGKRERHSRFDADEAAGGLTS